MGTAPPSVQSSFIAVMHMLAGLNINKKVVVDANGKLKDPTFEETLNCKILDCAEDFVEDLRALKEYIDPSKISSDTMELVRAAVKSAESDLDGSKEFKSGDPKEVGSGVFMFIKHALWYYDALVAVR